MYIERDLLQKIQPFLNNKNAIVITGMRRVGKTFFIKHIFEQIESDNKVFLDLENPLDISLLEEVDYNQIPKNLGIDTSRHAFVFIDEIQSFKQIPSIVKYLSDHYDIKFFLTGSASFYIHNMFTESLAGRKHIFEMFPFNFNEFLRAKDETPPPRVLSKSLFLKYKNLFAEYLHFGGFPKVVLAETESEKMAELKDIFSAYWLLEVKQLSDFRKKDKLRDFIFLLMERVGNKIDINKFSKELGITRNTVMDYLDFLQDTYLISTISPYSTNRDVEIRGAKKLYFIDSGLLNQFSRLDAGSIFENCIFNLLRHYGEVKYWQQKDGQEIDFIVNDKIAYEVKQQALDQHFKKLAHRAKKIGLRKYFVISEKHCDHPKTTYGFLL